jgi:hypothetical protein
MAIVTEEELKAHAKDGWVAFEGQVYDMSKFAPDHPGGAELVSDVLLFFWSSVLLFFCSSVLFFPPFFFSFL